MSNANPIYLPELRLMLAENDEEGLRAFVSELHPATVAEFAEGLSVEETWEVLAYAPLPDQAEVFSYFSNPKQEALVQGGGRQRMSALLEEMAPDNRVELLKRLEPHVVEELLPLVAKAERHDIRMLLSYPEDSAGSVMTTEYATVPEDVTAGEAINLLRTKAPSNETIYSIYVTDAHRRLLGSVSLRELILAKPTTLVSDLMERNVITVRVDDDQEQVARKLARYDFLAIPVVDHDNRLVGIVTHDDVIDVVVEEATEDAHRMGGVAPLESDYLHTPFATIWRKRSVWLSCLFVAEAFTFSAMGAFHETLDKYVILSMLVPLCIATGGNSGSQAATLITRAMALGQIELRDWIRVFRHEFLMGIALGLTLGIIGFFRVAMTPADIIAPLPRWELSGVIACSVFVICIWGSLVGSMLPLAFRRLGFDPGYASSPFVATFVDVTGIVIFLSFAQFLLSL